MAIVETLIADRLVDVMNADQPTLAYFGKQPKKIGGKQKDNYGFYAFWTVVNKEGRVVTARARVGLPAGERFDRMAVELRHSESQNDRIEYAQFFYNIMDSGRAVDYIRPATREEVKRWADSHEDDYRYCVTLTVAGKTMKQK